MLCLDGGHLAQVTDEELRWAQQSGLSPSLLFSLSLIPLSLPSLYFHSTNIEEKENSQGVRGLVRGSWCRTRDDGGVKDAHKSPSLT